MRNENLERLEIVNLPKGTKTKLKSLVKKSKSKSVNTFMVSEVEKLTKKKA